MKLSDIVNQLEIWGDWNKKYNHWVPKFIAEASTKTNYRDWDKKTFQEFFEQARDQSVSSLQQGYFSNTEKQSIKQNWNTLAPLFKSIAESQNSMKLDTYQAIDSVIRNHTSQHRRASVNRLIASLQPKLLCTIVNESKLNRLIQELNNKVENCSIKKTNNWFENSHAVLNFFANELNQPAEEIMTLPWQVYLKLTSKKPNLSTPNLMDDEDTNQEKPDSMEKALNQILYGPPGTGKTHVLKSTYFPAFTSHRTNVNDLDFKTRVRKYTWWQVIAAVFYNKPEGSTVPEIVNSKLIRAKHSPSVKYPDPNHIIWNILQKNPELFEKDINSIWKVKKKHVDDNYPVIEEIHGLLADDALSKLKLKEEEKENFKFVTFHQSFSYEDFIEGIKPVLTKDNEEKQKLNYEIGTGLFYDLCLKGIEMAGYESFLQCFEDNPKDRKEKFEAIKDDQEKQVAIFIDEINRGNVSAIFGELITLIEEDKRLGSENEIWVDLPYSKDKFGVPPNLYIIGTMNTADRSVEALDTALRRRFTFEEMLPKPELLSPSAMFSRLMWKHKELDWKDSPYLEEETALKELFGIPDGSVEWERRIATWNNQMKDKDESVLTHLDELHAVATLNLQELLETINDRIEVLVDRDHTIGHSYFMDVDSVESLKHAFKNKLIPLLQEYFYGDYRKMEMVIGQYFFDQEKKKTKANLFAVTQDPYDVETGVYQFRDINADSFNILDAIDVLLNKKKLEDVL